MSEKIKLFEIKEPLEKMAIINANEPNKVYVKREYMEKFLNEFSIKTEERELSFKVVDNLEENKSEVLTNKGKQ